jgi:beta-alanine--pyruvate transaminase
VIVEPFSGSAGVVMPPVGYLQRLREICTQHDILLIFDEVITGFGRSGAWTGAEAFGVTPDILNFAKQVTNGVQPLGGVVVRRGSTTPSWRPADPDYQLEFAHGYTYSAHPVACAAALATLDLLERSRCSTACAPSARISRTPCTASRASARRPTSATSAWPPASPSTPARRAAAPPLRDRDAHVEKGFYVRYGGDTMQAFAPPFISRSATA